MGFVAPPRIGTPEFDKWLAGRRCFNTFASYTLIAAGLALIALSFL